MALYYEQFGDQQSDTCLIFLHGGGVSSWMWNKQISYFKQFHCITVDLPEHGKSQTGEAFSIEQSAIHVLNLIQQYGKDKTIVGIGFSLGAQVLIQLLAKHPTTLHFALINSACVRPAAYIQNWIGPTIKLSFPLIKYRWFAKLQARTLYLDNENFEQYYKESLQIKPDTLIRVLQQNMSFSIPTDFKNVQTKILVTVGEQEKSIMLDSAKDLVAANKHCTGIIIPKVGHGASIAMPEVFNTLVETWIHNGGLPENCKVIH